MNAPDDGAPEFYREQARRIRELAAQASIASIKTQLETVALQYERLADHAERRKRHGRY
jgi:hypothetical protein